MYTTSRINKPTLFVIYISIACSIGFISGMYFDGYYNRDIAVELVSEFKEVRKFFENYENIIINDRVLNDLNSIKNLNDLDAIRDKYREYGLSSVHLFKKQANTMKDNSANSSAIMEFEKKVEEFEKNFKQEQPLAINNASLGKTDS